MNTRSLPVTGRWSIRSYTASLPDFIIGYRIIRIFPDTNATCIELFYYLFIETRRFRYLFSTTYSGRRYRFLIFPKKSQIRLRLSSSRVAYGLLRYSARILIATIQTLLRPYCSICLSSSLINLTAFSPPKILAEGKDIPFSNACITSIICAFDLSCVMTGLIRECFI